ncbi:MAG: Tfp pilus assembly protein FimT/FimU [Phycisphaerales bacterium JB063]
MQTRRATSRRRTAGFSLIELVIVVTLIGILGVIAAPRFANASARQRVIAAANRIEADIKLAQQYARASSDEYTLSFSDPRFYQCTSADGLREQTVNINEEPYGAKVKAMIEGGGTDLVFNGYGLPRNGAIFEVVNDAHRITLKIDPITGEVTQQ